MDAVITHLIVMPQAWRFMANQTHSVSDESEAFSELTLLGGHVPGLVNFATWPSGSDYQTGLILDEQNFVKKLLHQFGWWSHHRHACHVGQVAVVIAGRVER